MKTIGTHAKHALALFLALIMLFGIVSVPVFAYEGSTASTDGEENSSAGGEESGGGSSDTEGTKDTPWYTLTYNYTTKQMTLVLKMEDLLSYADLTAEDLVTFKDEFFDAMTHMLVGDISEIKKLASSTESSSEEGTLRIVTLPDFAPLLDGGTTELSEREKQLRAFLESRGITKVSQIDFEAIIPVLIQLGYVTYEELAEIDWNRVFEKFEEELEKEIERDIAVDIAKEADPDFKEPDRADYSDDESYAAAKEEYDNTITEIIDKKDSEYKDAFEEKANSEEIVAKKEESLGQITEAKEKVEQKIEEKKNDPTADDRSDVLLTEAILNALNGVTVDGHKIFDGKHFLSDAVREVLRELPTADEIANYTDEQMKHTWSVYAESAFGDSTFDFTISFDGGGNLIRKLARLVADYVVYERRDDGTYFITLNLPKKVTDLILRACNSEKFQNSAWKDRIFGHIADNGNDIYALVNDVTFEEIISALEEIDFEGLLSRDDIKDIYDLSDLTNDEIIAKLRKTERFYKKALSLFNKLFTRLPEGTKAKTLFDFYRGNGSFHAEGRKENLNVEAWLDSVLPEAYEKYAALIAGLLDSETLTVGLNATVNFKDMYKITFTGDETELGFLPAGAKLADFVKATTYRGYPILGWADEDGKTYTKMPAADTVLYPVIDATVVARLVYTESEISKIYDNTSATLRVTVDYDEQSENVVYTYRWQKNGVDIEGATTDTITVKNVADSGAYTCIVTVTDGTAVYHATSDEATVEITKRLYTFKDNFRWDYEGVFYPDGTTRKVNLLFSGEAYAGISIVYTGDANEQTATGNYKTGATVTFANVNCALSGEIETLSWAIGATEFLVLAENGETIGRVTLTTGGIAADPSYIFRAKAVTSPALTAFFAALPEGFDKDTVNVPYAFDFAFYDADGNRVDVKSALKFSFDIDPAIEKSHIAFFRIAEDGTVSKVDSERTDDALTCESDALLTAESVRYALVSYQYTLELALESDSYVGTYDGLEHFLRLAAKTYGHKGAEVTYTYQWFKDGAKITGANESSYAVKNHADSGTYTLVVTVTDGYAERTASIENIKVDIAKLTIDLSSLKWSATELPYYAGVEQEVTLIVSEDLAIANLVFAYTNNKATDPGTYTATATVASYDRENCELTGALSGTEWTISNKSYVIIEPTTGCKIIVTSEAGFPDGYELRCEWIDLSALDLSAIALGDTRFFVKNGGFKLYFVDKDGNPVTFAGTVKVTFEIPAEGLKENLKLVLGNGTLLDAARSEDGKTVEVTLDSFDKDAVYAMLAYRYDLKVADSGDVDIAYEAGKTFTLIVTPTYREGTWNFKYQWYKNGDLLEGETSATLEVPMAAGDATYTCTVSVEDGYATVTANSREIKVTVSASVIDVGGVSLPEFIYRLMAEDPTIEITAEDLLNLPKGVIATIDRESTYKAANVGTYDVKVFFALDDAHKDNCELSAGSRTITWRITPYNILIGTPSWNYVSSLIYKGSDYTFTAPALDAHPYLTVVYSQNTAKNVGSYTATATVTPKNENCLVNGETEVKYSATFRIEPKTISVDLIEWEEETFVYDGKTHRPTLRNFDYDIAGVYEALSDILVVSDYAGVFASDVLPAGASLYTVTAFLAIKDNNPNYRLTASKKVLEWNITPKPLDIDGVKLEENLFDYDGTTKTVKLLADSIPEELRAVLDPSTEITATDRGYHSVTVNFTLKAGYNRLNYTFETSVNIPYRIVTAIDPADFTFTDGGFVYDGSEKTVPALSFGPYAALVRLTGSEGTFTATDAGTYRVTYTFALTSSSLFRLTAESYTYEWTIAKQKISVGTLNWNYDPENPFVYNKNTFTVALTNEIENVQISYENASATDAGTYLAKAILTPVSENYEIVLEDEASTELSWTVKQAVIRIPVLEWIENNAFEYDGNEKSVGLKTELSEDITVEYENAAMTDAGKYLAKATLLAKDKNYRVAIGDTEENTVTLEWEITPITVIVGTLEWNYTDRNFVFGTDSRSFLITNLPAHVSAVYENNTIGDVGTYTLKVTLVADKNYKIQGTEEETFDFEVTPLTVTVNASDLRWTTDAASERYDGTTHTYTLIGVPAHVVIRYTDNASSAIGNYVAKAVLEAESANYTLVVSGEIPEQAWSIVKGKYDMSGIKFEDRTEEYDGKAKTFTITGTLPAGVSVTYSLSNFKDAGVYVVTATFKGSQNYEEIPSMTATLTITRLQYTVAVGGNDTLIITAPSELTYTLKFIEKENAEFKDQSFLGIGTLNEQIKLAAAYDIFFTEDGETEVHPEGNFEVKLLIPEALRKKDIKVVHRNDDGKLTDMEATRDGDYMVFTTDGFSVYFLVEATPILSDLWISVIMIALCVLLVLIIILEIVAWKKKKKKRNARKEYPDILKGADPTAFNFGK